MVHIGIILSALLITFVIVAITSIFDDLELDEFDPKAVLKIFLFLAFVGDAGWWIQHLFFN